MAETAAAPQINMEEPHRPLSKPVVFTTVQHSPILQRTPINVCFQPVETHSDACGSTVLQTADSFPDPPLMFLPLFLLQFSKKLTDGLLSLAQH